MGVTIKSIDPKSSMRKFVHNINNITASNNVFFVQVPYACTYDKFVYARALASAGCVIDICNVSYSQAFVSAGSTAADNSGAIGSIQSLSATQIFSITANSLLQITLSGTTTDGAVALYFTIDENKEK